MSAIPPFLVHEEFAPGRTIRHAFSTRIGGSPPGAPPGSEPRFFREAPWPAGAAFAPLRQVHGRRTVVLGAVPAAPPEADAAVTARQGLVLLVRTADCIPVLLADAAAGIVGAAHAGWRGILAGVVAAVIDRMRATGASPARIEAVLGPGIGPCCFEVGDQVAAPFAALSPELVRRAGARPHVDLPAAVRLRLEAAGVRRVLQVGDCTACRTDTFWSHRRQGPAAGRLLAGIALA